MDRSTRTRAPRGFTLIELMIVVVIIVVLATVAIVSYTRHIKSSRLIDARVFVSTIQSREEMYRQQFGVYYDASNNGAAAGGADVYYPPLGSSEPVAKQWPSPLLAAQAGWALLGARPESGTSYFEFTVRASYGPGHGLYGEAAVASSALTIPNPAATGVPAPWYYVVARADINGNGASCGAGYPYTDCTVLASSSVSGNIVTLNEGQ